MTWAPGAADVNSGPNQTLIAAAVAQATAADVVVLAVGTELSTAGEGHDAESLEFSAGQQQLISAVLAAAKAPVVVVTLTAVPLDISTLMADSRVGAIVHAGQPAVNTLGVGDVLFGGVSPAGRTGTSVPRPHSSPTLLARIIVLEVVHEQRTKCISFRRV